MENITVIPANKFENNNGFIGANFIRQFSVPAGGELQGHKHLIDHITYLAKGRVVITLDGGQQLDVSAPNFINVQADVLHHFKVVDDSVWYCIFSEAEAKNVLESDHEIYMQARSV